nr:MAG TPA: hypothetical protein [Caudoviricetes sp.]
MKRIYIYQSVFIQSYPLLNSPCFSPRFHQTGDFYQSIYLL